MLDTLGRFDSCRRLTWLAYIHCGWHILHIAYKYIAERTDDELTIPR